MGYSPRGCNESDTDERLSTRHRAGKLSRRRLHVSDFYSVTTDQRTFNFFEFQLFQAVSTANACSFHSSKITETMIATVTQAKPFCVSPQQKRKFCCKYEEFLSLSTEAVICCVEPCFQCNGKNCFFHSVLQRRWLLKYHKQKEFLHNTSVTEFLYCSF